MKGKKVTAAEPATGVCAGCGIALPAPPTTGRPRLWCSERCRMRERRIQRRARQRMAETRQVVEMVTAAMLAVVDRVMLHLPQPGPVERDTISADAHQAAAELAQIVLDATKHHATQPDVDDPDDEVEDIVVAQATQLDATGRDESGADLRLVHSADRWPASVCDGGEHQQTLTVQAWDWAQSDDCPTSWWSTAHRPTSREAAEQLRREFDGRDVNLAGSIDEILAAVQAAARKLGRKVTPPVAKDRVMLARTLTQNNAGTVQSALLWALDDKYWSAHLTARATPAKATTIIQQWQRKFRPDLLVDDPIRKNATSLAATWAQLYKHPLSELETAVSIGRAATVLSGDGTRQGLPADEAERILRWMYQPEHRTYYTAGEFPSLRDLHRAQDRSAGESPRRGGQTSGIASGITGRSVGEDGMPNYDG